MRIQSLAEGAFVKVVLDIPDEKLTHIVEVFAKCGGTFAASRTFMRLEGGDWLINGQQYNHMNGFAYIQTAIVHGDVSSLDLARCNDYELSKGKVASACRRAQKAIAKVDPELAAHLREHLSVGYDVKYSGSLDWLT